MGKQDGVCIGVATTALPQKTQGKHDGRRPSQHFCQMAKNANQNGAELYLFHPNDIHFATHCVDAWEPEVKSQPYGAWVKRRLRLPDVIYENIYVHLAIGSVPMKMRRDAKAYGIPLFNPIMPGKWKLDRLLRKSELVHYLPETHLLQGSDSDIVTIRRFKTAYIKPVGGYGGIDVSRVQVLAQNRFRASVDRVRNGSKQIREELSEPELKIWLKKRVKEAHLLQKGLDLLTVRGRRVDFRVVVHRDGHGQWKLVGIVPKVAARDGVVTNIIAGGERMSLLQLQNLAKTEGKTIPVDGMTQCAIDIAQFIQQRCPYAALIGFDLGVEQDGTVAMIEMNPKPARSLLSPEMRTRVAQYAVEYAIYLASRK